MTNQTALVVGLTTIGNSHLMSLMSSEVFFKIKFIYFSGTLNLQIYILIIFEKKRGELSDISSQMATLLMSV